MLKFNRHTKIFLSNILFQNLIKDNLMNEKSLDDNQYNLDEILSKSNDNNVLMSFQGGVYDLTKFIDIHPGGKEKIIMANGKRLEYFFNLYPIHFNNKVYNILEKYKIGNLEEKEIELGVEDIINLFDNEPGRSPILKVLNNKPFDSETPFKILVNNYYTPNNYFYVRNHFSVPEIKIKEHTIIFDIPKELGSKGITEYSIQDLTDKFEKYEIDSLLFCTGFRAKEMTGSFKDSEGGQIGNARWKGFLLRDILIKCGLNEREIFLNNPSKEWHIYFTGVDGYIMSIPLEIGLRIDQDVMLVTEMNGEKLPRDHGYPIRIIVPSFVGARSVKWLESIEIREKEPNSEISPFHSNIYRIWPNYVKEYDKIPLNDSKILQRCPPIYHNSCNSLILYPENKQQLELLDNKQSIEVRGIAFGSEGKSIIDVQVYYNGSWRHAEIYNKKNSWGRNWSWTTWKLEIPYKDVENNGKGNMIMCRAIDSSYTSQYTSIEKWNLRGYLNTNYHSCEFYVKKV